MPTLYDAVQLVLVFVLLPPESQQLQDLLLGRAGLLQLLQAFAIHLPPGKILQEPLQRYRGQPQRGERLVDSLLTQGRIWKLRGARRKRRQAYVHCKSKKERKLPALLLLFLILIISSCLVLHFLILKCPDIILLFSPVKRAQLLSA